MKTFFWKFKTFKSLLALCCFAVVITSSSAWAERFQDNYDGTVTDTDTNLMWTKNAKPLAHLGGLDWDEAHQHLANLKMGGYSDWRLPTRDELNYLIVTLQ